MGAYVSLLEYNGIEGMILLSELSRRRIRSITKLIKVGAAYHFDTVGKIMVPRHSFTTKYVCGKHTGWPPRACDGAACGQGEGLHRFVQKVLSKCSLSQL